MVRPIGGLYFIRMVILMSAVCYPIPVFAQPLRVIHQLLRQLDILFRQRSRWERCMRRLLFVPRGRRCYNCCVRHDARFMPPSCPGRKMRDLLPVLFATGSSFRLSLCVASQGVSISSLPDCTRPGASSIWILLGRLSSGVQLIRSSSSLLKMSEDVC